MPHLHVYFHVVECDPIAKHIIMQVVKSRKRKANDYTEMQNDSKETQNDYKESNRLIRDAKQCIIFL